MADQLLSTDAVHRSLPPSYVWSEHDRPRLHEVATADDIPIIDLGQTDRSGIVSQIAAACASYGFFQVRNHGVTAENEDGMQGIAGEFFRLPAEEKRKLYSDDPAKKMRLSTSFNVRKETIHNWRDYLRLHCCTLDKLLVVLNFFF